MTPKRYKETIRQALSVLLVICNVFLFFIPPRLNVNATYEGQSSQQASTVRFFQRIISHERIARTISANEKFFVRIADLAADDGMLDDLFGASVDIDGNTLAVGAYGVDGGGAVYIFTNQNNEWVQQTKLLVNGSGALGSSVDLDGDTLLVGASYEEVKGNTAQGAAYIFTRQGNVWSQQARLIASDGHNGDYFGTSVALDGDVAVIGAFEAIINMPYQGAAYVFTRQGDTWAQEQKLLVDDSQLFGVSVAISADTIVIGAPWTQIGSHSSQGAAYVFIRQGSVWSQQAQLTTDDGMAHDRFGRSVTLEGDTVFVGAPGADWDGIDRHGAAYIFTRQGDVWSQQARLTASDNIDVRAFGTAIGLKGDIVIIGAPESREGWRNEQGAAFTFVRQNSLWIQKQKLTVTGDLTSSDNFGNSVALDGDTAIIGAYQADVNEPLHQGKAYVYQHMYLYQVYLPVVISP